MKTNSLLFFVLMLTCCCSSVKSVETNSKTSLFDTKWIVKTINGEKVKVAKESMPYLQFSDGTLIGYSACNRINGAYTIDKESIVFDRMLSTKMYCHETQEIEQLFMQTLHKVKQWQIKKQTLQLLDEYKNVIIELEQE